MPKIFTALDKIKPAYDITYRVVLVICKLLLIVDVLIISYAACGRGLHDYISFFKAPA